jgi:hypothetical protein
MPTVRNATIWERLSPSCRTAFGWAVALDPNAASPKVYTENLLLGLIRTHEPTSEPEVLLKHYGRSVLDLEVQVQRVSGHHLLGVQSPISLLELPALSRNTQRALDEAVKLSRNRPWSGDTVRAPHLFGGLLKQPKCFAYDALQAALGADADLARIADLYVGAFLTQGPEASYVGFLNAEEPASSSSAASAARTDAGRPKARDQVEWVADAPASIDLLKRQSIATALAQRLRRIDQGAESKGDSFLVHIDGPWGSGKSTLLDFLNDDLCQDWLIVRFDAWRQSRVGPPWWSLLTRLRHDMASGMRGPARFRLRWAETLERVRHGGAPYVLSLVLLSVAAVGLFILLRPQHVSIGNAGNIAASVGAIVATLATVWGGALILSRFLLWDSALGARLYEQSQQNPMETLTAHFGWLVGRAKRPVAFFIDDLDRCNDKYVVDLLDSVQTLIRESSRGPNSCPDGPRRQGDQSHHAPYFVVCADGAWLRRCYEKGYGSFAGAVGQPGRSLGYLFLDKIFQLTVPVPLINAATQESYIRALLGFKSEDSEQILSEKETVASRVQDSTTRDEALEALESASPEVRRDLAPELVRKLNTPDVSRVTEHALTKFATLLEPNPRAMKRFLNAFSIADSVLVLQDVFVGQDELALWTILRLRWPDLGDYLRGNPEAVQQIGAKDFKPDGLPRDLAPLFSAKEVTAIVHHTQGGPLKPDSVRSCSGISVDKRVLEATVLKT